MPLRVDPTQEKEEKAALKKVITHSFTANPGSVKTSGPTEISWNVVLPPAPAVDINLKLNGQTVAPVGSKKFSLLQTTPFTLTAVTENAGTQLGTLTVNVDASDCRSKLVVDSFFITQQLTFNINNQFRGNSQVKLRGKGAEATLGDRAISIGVPLEIEVPNWFNAEMSIGIQLEIPGGAPAVVLAKSVDVNVCWFFLEHLASLGCTGLVQNGMEQLAQVFLSNLVDSQLVPTIERTFNDEVSKFVLSLRDTDLRHRTYIPISMVLTPDGLTITACPKA